jgi:hypothetical protein
MPGPRTSGGNPAVHADSAGRRVQSYDCRVAVALSTPEPRKKAQQAEQAPVAGVVVLLGVAPVERSWSRAGSVCAEVERALVVPVAAPRVSSVVTVGWLLGQSGPTRLARHEKLVGPLGFEPRTKGFT